MLKEYVDFLREQFPEGSRVRVRDTDNDALSRGCIGILKRITDEAGFCVTWEDGQEMELKLGKDRFSVLPAEFRTLKLYMPVTADMYTSNKSGSPDRNFTELDGRHLAGYKDIIAAALRENYSPEEQERGIMHWYEDDTALDIKVHSVFLGVEERDGCLWGVAECRVAGELSPLELAELKDHLTSHTADNWGELFSHQAIKPDEGEMYVYLWNSVNWSIRTEQELFGAEQARSDRQPNEPRQDGMRLGRGESVSSTIGEDGCTVTLPEPVTLKLYMPLTANVYPSNDHGDIGEDSYQLWGRELRIYEDMIMAALVKNRAPEEAERGIMHWYRENDSVDEKVKSVVFTVENRDGHLWGVAECQVAGELTREEMATLREYITGQASDGWGEGFEQRGIGIDDGEMYVHLWNCEDWDILTEREWFGPQCADDSPQMEGINLG